MADEGGFQSESGINWLRQQDWARVQADLQTCFSFLADKGVTDRVGRKKEERQEDGEGEIGGGVIRRRLFRWPELCI